MNGVIYARYSSDSQREESIEDQIAVCTAYAKKHDINIINTYTDKALTATSDKRPSFLRMIKDSEKREWECIVCYKTDRFARSREDASKYKRKLRDNGVSVVYAEMTIPTGPEGIILEGVMEAIDEWYSANLSQNVRRGMYGNAKKCKTNGVRVFGYKTSITGEFEIDEPTAYAVRKVFQMTLENISDTDIVKWLNSNGYVNTRGKPFTYGSLTRMTTNRKYIGEYNFKNIVVKDGMPAIIDKETFERVQLIRQSRRSIRSRNRMCVLSGLLYCGECGEPMHGSAGTSHSGKRYQYYMCNSKEKKNGSCKNKRFDQATIETRIVKTLANIIFNGQNLEDLLDALEAYQKENKRDDMIKQYESELREVRQAMTNITKAIERGAISNSLIDRLNDLESRGIELNNNLTAEKLKLKILDRETLRTLLVKYQSLSLTNQETQKRLVRTFVKKAYLYKDGKIVLVLNYNKNGTPEILECSEVRENVFGAPNNPKLEPLNYRKYMIFVDDCYLYIAF